MMKRIGEISKDELINGSVILFVMLLAFNFFNYVFQISMAKILGPADFGILATLMSLIYILSIPGEAIQTITSKYTSKFNSPQNKGKIKDLLYRGAKKSFLLSCVFFILFAVLSLFLSDFLKIQYFLLVLTGLYLFYVFIIPVGRGVLQGRKKFVGMGLSFVLESILKVIIALILVYIGWKVYGAMAGVIFAGLISFAIVVLMLKDIIAVRKEPVDFSGAYWKSVPVLLGITSVILMYSLDIIFARAFFSPEIAGQYAFISLIGKVIIFASFSIGRAMLPISTEEFEKGGATEKLFKKSVILVSALSFFILIFYSLFPETIIRIISLGSEEYASAAGILIILGAAYTLLSFSYIIIMYKLSVNKLNGHAYVTLVFVLLEVILFALFHSTIYEFSIAFGTANLLMFLYCIWLIKR